MLQSLCDLCRYPDGVADRQAPSLRLINQTEQLTTRPVLADDIRFDQPARADLLTGVEDSHDVRVVAEATHRLCLTLDARQPGLVQPFRLNDSEGDVAIQFGVVGEVDALAAALSEK
jgi:hypothetical protein